MRNRKRDMQCLKPKGHNGAHSYTWTVRGDGASSKKGAVGLGVAKEIMQLLTPRQVKSLAGLDDIATTKGHDNFFRLP